MCSWGGAWVQRAQADAWSWHYRPTTPSSGGATPLRRVVETLSPMAVVLVGQTFLVNRRNTAYFNTPVVSFYVLRNALCHNHRPVVCRSYVLMESLQRSADPALLSLLGLWASCFGPSLLPIALRHNLEITCKGADPEGNSLLTARQFTTNISTRCILWRLQSTEICFWPTLPHTCPISREGGKTPFNAIGVSASVPRNHYQPRRSPATRPCLSDPPPDMPALTFWRGHWLRDRDIPSGT